MSILAEILATKEGEVAAARARRPQAEVERAALAAAPPRSLATALARAAGEPVRVIAEVKRASPSAGPIRPDADPAAIAREYAAAGAAAISILTDESYFDGHLGFLAAARAAVDVPLLRKDFIVDPYQIAEARAAGADAVLLIVAALDDHRLAALIAEAGRFGMDALVEIHAGDEAMRALHAGAGIIGVNHRNLATFEVDTSLSAALRPHIPPAVIMVGESGIASAADVRRLGAAGVDAVLVGERLMRARSPGAALAELLEGAGA
jgi:indole-3-glycerol phosphate synthase